MASGNEPIDNDGPNKHVTWTRDIVIQNNTPHVNGYTKQTKFLLSRFNQN